MRRARRAQLVVFVKEPRPGRVKTRLAKGLGAVAAAWWFRLQALRLVRSLARDPRWETRVAVSPDRDGLGSRVWPRGVRRQPQGTGDLGARMLRALRDAPPGPVVVVGADVPGISPGHVARAFAALGSSEAVFGPAEDGGYWLVGLARGRRRVPAGFLAGVRWSTEFALADSVASLGDARCTYVDRLADVDTVEDLRRLSARQPFAPE